MLRPQFTLRALLVLLLAVACFLGGIRFEKERQRRADEAGRAVLAVESKPIQVVPKRGKIEETFDKFDYPQNRGRRR